jgi:hypothetical protein
MATRLGPGGYPITGVTLLSTVGALIVAYEYDLVITLQKPNVLQFNGQNLQYGGADLTLGA